MWNFYTVLLQIHLGNCLQKIGVLLDLSLIKLLQNEQGCNFFASQCSLCYAHIHGCSYESLRVAQIRK